MKEVLVDVERCLGCHSCEIACAVQHSRSRNLFSAIREPDRPRRRVHVEAAADAETQAGTRAGTRAETGVRSFPLQCRHCQDAPCVDACMTGAMHLETGGRVVNDPNRCVGCWMCLMVCPFGAITTRQQPKLALKCDRCPDLTEPACVSACPTGALTFAEPDAFAQTRRERVATQIPNIAGYLAGKL